ncbi:MAG: cupredoxin family protein [Alphaproteobacteria bacterium]|nr:cupredoxin family protein [Alphaproteobacteria bacterium]
MRSKGATMHPLAAILAAALLAAAPAAAGPGAPGHGHGAKGHADAAPYGEPGDPGKPARIVQIVMRDEMRFVPDRVTVRRGENVRFVARNPGELRHEMVLGTMAELKEHAQLMLRFPDMEHDDPNALTLPPKKSGELYWRFTNAGTFHLGCLVPGHLEQGMIATVVVR